MTITNTPILFLSGAGLPAWIWDDVRADLSTDTAVAAYPKNPESSLSDYASQVLADAAWPRFHVVAHSVGGVVASQVVAQEPDRVAGFLGIAASVPAAGRSFAASLPFPQSLIIGAVTRIAGTRPPEKAIRSTLVAGVDAPAADRIVAEFSPESKRLYLDPVGERTFPALRGYLETSNDREFTVPLQRRFAGNLGGSWVRTLDTGHLPMLEDPAAVAAAIREFTA